MPVSRWGRAERRRYQEELEQDARENERPAITFRAVPKERLCSASMGRAHDFTLGGGRCIYCCKTRAEVAQNQETKL